MRKEKSVFELYKENYVHNVSQKSYNLGDVRDLLKKVVSCETFPILIEKNELKTAQMIHDLSSLEGAMIDFIDAWEKVYNKKPLIKNITQVSEGRLFEIELRLIYIEVFSIEKKYPEFSIGKLMEVLEYPDFSDILKMAEALNSKWYLIHDTVKSVCSMEDLYSNGKPKIEDKWVEKLEIINQVTIKNEDEKKEFIVMFSFVEAFLQMLSFCEFSRSHYDDLLEFMGDRDFIDFDRMKIEVSKLQSRLGLITRIAL